MPTLMSVASLVRVFTSIVDTMPLRVFATKAVLPSGVTAIAVGNEPTGMSVGCLVRVFTSIVDTVSLSWLLTNAVDRHRARTGTADAPSGTTPTRRPRHPEPHTPTTPRKPPHRWSLVCSRHSGPVTGDTA